MPRTKRGCVHPVPAPKPFAVARGYVGYPSPSRLASGMSLTSAPMERLVDRAAGKLKDRLPKARDGEVANVCTARPGCKRDVSLDAQLCREGSGVHPMPRASLTPHAPAALCRVLLTRCHVPTEPNTRFLGYSSPNYCLYCFMCQHPGWGGPGAALLPACSSALQSAEVLITLC